MMDKLLRQEGGILYVRCWYSDYEPNVYRDVAVSAIEAEQSLAAEAAFLPEAGVEERAKYVAREKFMALNKADFGHPLPTASEVRAKLSQASPNGEKNG